MKTTQYAPHGRLNLPAYLTLACLALAACSETDPPPENVAPVPPEPLVANENLTPANSEPPRFDERAAVLGIDFRYENGLSDQFHIVETIGGGLGAIDYDLDGDQDLILIQGGDPHRSPAHPIGDRLLRNQLVETGVLAFDDVSEGAGIQGLGFGLGVTFGDLNGDAWPDIYVSNYGPNQAWINQGDGTFKEGAESLGIADPGMSTGAVFADFDRDGDEDLMLANYVRGDQQPLPCLGRDSLQDYCSPKSWAPQANRFYENLGDRFVDASEKFGIASDPRTSFQVLPLDVNNDGWLDLLVANDGMENRLWVNQAGKVFIDQGSQYGVAVNLGGVPEASMGVDLADYDGDGQLDLFMTHLRGESNTMYRGLADRGFLDSSARSGLAGSDLPYTGWGVRSLDYNLDGWPDLFIVNGAESIGNRPRPEILNQAFMQPNLAYRNASGRFEVVSNSMPEAWQQVGNSRGLVSADFDNDGKVDLAAVHAGGEMQLFVNQFPTQSWIGFELREQHGPWPRWPLMLTLEGAKRRFLSPSPLSGFLSISDPRVVIPVTESAPLTLLVDWGDGSTQRFENLAPGQYHLLQRSVQ